MTKRKALTIRSIIYIVVLIFPIGMFVGTINRIQQLNNHKVETITFASIRHIEADSDYYLLKDNNDREFEIETHYKQAFRYNQFINNVEVGDELTITYISTKTVLEVKNTTYTFLGLEESTKLLNQSNIFFIMLSLILFVLIVSLEVREHMKWIKSDAYKELK